MEDGLKRRKEAMLKAGIEEEYQKRKNKDSKVVEINNLGVNIANLVNS